VAALIDTSTFIHAERAPAPLNDILMGIGVLAEADVARA
jgi:hypothetical protein